MASANMNECKYELFQNYFKIKKIVIFKFFKFFFYFHVHILLIAIALYCVK